MPAYTSNLLGLPLETRLQIIRDVLASVDKAPVIEEIIEDRIPYRFLSQRSEIYVPRVATPAFHGNGLLLTNKQLSKETKYVLQSMREKKTKGFEFVLDVMYVRGVGLLPTWLSVPLKTKDIGTLRVQFRIVRPPASLIERSWMAHAQFPNPNLATHQVSTWLAHVLLSYAFRRMDMKHLSDDDEHDVEDAAYIGTELSMNGYTVDQLLIDVHPFQVVSDGETADGWSNGMIPRAYDINGCFPFGCGTYLGMFPMTPEEAGLLFRNKTTALHASLDLGERLEGLLDYHVHDVSQNPELEHNRETLLNNVGVISIRVVDSHYTELKDLADKIEKLRLARNMT